MKLTDIMGQEHIISLLTASLESGRISHAYLFSGPEGTGKTTTAMLFAMALNCERKGQDKELPCGICSSCRRMKNLTYPDLKVIEPSGLSIKIDQIREVQREIALKSYEGGWRIFLIKDAETMTLEAGNSLLKVLEEPTAHCVLILISHNYLEMLETIRSRCQLMEFRKMSSPVLEELLIEKYSCSPERASLLSGLADGAIGRALQLNEDQGFFSLRENVLNLLFDYKNQDILKALNFFEELEDSKDKSREIVLDILDILKTWYRDLVVYSYCGDTFLLINQDKKYKIIEEAKVYSIDRLQEIIQKIDDVRYGIERAKGANLPLAVDRIFVELFSEKLGH